MRTCNAFLLALLSAGACADDVTIRLPNALDIEAWVLPSQPDQMPSAGRRFHSAQFSVATTADTARGVIVLLDTLRGNVAVRAVSSMQGHVWQVKPDEWRIGQVSIEVFAKGDVMPRGLMEATGNTYHQTQQVENGKAVFFAVPISDVSFVVHYTSRGIDKKSPPQMFRLALKRDDEVPSFAITVRDSVDGSVAVQPASKERSGAPLINLLIIAAGLGALLGGIYSVLKWLKANPDRTEAGLKKLGLEPIKPADPDDVSAAVPVAPPPIVPAGHCEFCGNPLADCTCSTGLRPQTSPPVASSGPRLVGDFGVLELGGGSTIIGREGALVINDATVSRQHAEVTVEEGNVSLSDLGSSNGTFVNGLRIETATQLRSGDVVQFGSVRMRFEA